MGVFHYLDTILVPLSLLITFGYHAYLWHNFKKKPYTTTIGINTIKRRLWLQEMKQGNDTHGMLAVQSLRNTLMATILTATITALVTLSLAALTNNSYSVKKQLLMNKTYTNYLGGLETNKLLLLKYASTSMFLLASFFCSSMALANLVDANYLVYAMGGSGSGAPHAQTILERGFMLALVGNRVLCIAFPLLFWMLGPLLVALSSLALVSALYVLDFIHTNLPTTTTRKERRVI